MEDNNRTNLIINYIPQTLTDEEFRSMFLSIGPIKSAKIVRDKATGYSYGFGFVDYEKVEDAQRAMQTLNGLQMQNKTIKVALARPGGEEIKGANLYVRNLPRHYQQMDLERLFQRFGTIIQSRVLTDQSTGQSKGVGFVLFDQKKQAEEAISQISGTVPAGGTEPLLIKFADDNAKKVRPPAMPYINTAPCFPAPGPGPMRSPGNRFRYNPVTGNYSTPNSGLSLSQGGYVLFVYNIGTNSNEKTLWQLFSPFGTVQKVNIMRDHQKGQSKNYGFVTMTNLQEAQNAIGRLNGYDYTGCGRPLQVKFKN